MMPPILRYGLDFIVWLQQARCGALDVLFKTITFLGSEYFYLLFVPILYWCMSRMLAVRIGFLILISGWVNLDLKELFQQARPFAYLPHLQISHAEGYSLPSGHAQLSIALWGYLASLVSRKEVRLIIAIGVFLIGLSRVYLGLHFPSDVLLGWVIGGVLLLVFLYWEKAVVEALYRFPSVGVLLLLYALCAIIYAILPIARSLFVIAALTGVAAGLVIDTLWVRFSAQGSAKEKILRLLLGLILMAALYGFFKLILAGRSVAHSDLTTFVVFWNVGFAISGWIPGVFVWVGLARPRG